jgi:hypothetical protein
MMSKKNALIVGMSLIEDELAKIDIDYREDAEDMEKDPYYIEISQAWETLNKMLHELG